MDESLESEKMTALKKAYAEIILSTTKEAAARIMVSERKAHRCHYDLSATKEEALRLLLRLKQTMDCKINELEMKSQDQQRKIDELEAQLQEAEDIVGNLRAELNLAHMKLEKWASNQMYSGFNTTHDADNENRRSQTENDPCEAILASQANKIQDNNLEESDFSGEPEIPSIIRRRTPEVYLNGCSRGIRTCDGNLLKGHFSLAGGLDHLKTVIDDDITCVQEEKPVDLKEIEDDDRVNIMHVLNSLTRRRKQGPKDKKSNASSLKCASHVMKEPCYDLSTSHDHDHDMHENDETLKEVANEDGEVGSASGVSLDIVGTNKGLEVKNSSSLDVDVKLLETSDGLSSPPSKDRVLKYTFQRKRKKESVVSDDNGLLHEENILRGKLAKKQNGIFKPVKSSEGTEPLQDGRRMAQVARQLVSMSEKKWIK